MPRACFSFLLCTGSNTVYMSGIVGTFCPFHNSPFPSMVKNFSLYPHVSLSAFVRNIVSSNFSVAFISIIASNIVCSILISEKNSLLANFTLPLDIFHLSFGFFRQLPYLFFFSIAFVLSKTGVQVAIFDTISFFYYLCLRS